MHVDLQAFVPSSAQLPDRVCNYRSGDFPTFPVDFLPGGEGMEQDDIIQIKLGDSHGGDFRGG